MAISTFGAIQEVPEFLGEHVAYCDYLVFNRNDRSCIVLARNLKFYEFCRKELVYSIDLAGTCLDKIAQKLHDYKGSKGKWLENVPQPSENVHVQQGFMESTSMSASQTDERQFAKTNVCFGRYVYRNINIKKLFLLICCWNKLVVLERVSFDKIMTSKCDGYRVVEQYDAVSHFKIAHSKVKFQAAVTIHFENGTIKTTDFQNGECGLKERVSSCDLVGKNNVKHLFDRIRCARAELQLHKTTTQKEFYALRDIQMFGCDFLRSAKLEEKPMLARCGDIWLRFTLNDYLVCGIPILNNCSSENLTILKNIKPILKISGGTSKCLSYKYEIRQLRQSFENLETIETFFDTISEDIGFSAAKSQWMNVDAQLISSSFAVVLISLKLTDIITITDCPVFLYFEIEKKIPQPEIIKTSKTKIYKQHLFIKNLNFIEILTKHNQYNISFAQSTLNQDLLATAMTSEEINLQIEFVTSHEEYRLHDLISSKLKFEVIKNGRVTEKKHREEINTGQNFDSLQFTLPHMSYLFFNKDPKSLWFGSVIVKANYIEKQKQCEDNTITIWKIFIPSKEKTLVLLKMLFTELVVINCNISHTEFLRDRHNCDNIEFLQLHNLLSQELRILNEFSNHKNANKYELFSDILKLQVKTDIAVSMLDTNCP